MNKNKRKAHEISAAKSNINKKSSTNNTMNANDIRAAMQEALNENLKDIRETLKCVVKLSDLENLHVEIRQLQSCNQTLTEKVTALEDRCEFLEEKMEADQMRRTEANLIFHMQHQNAVQPKDQIQTICRTHGKIASPLTESNIIPIRSKISANSSFLVRLQEKTSAINILRATKVLREGGVVIH